MATQEQLFMVPAQVEGQETEVGFYVTFTVEDFGIGPYEFWGASGNQVLYGWEVGNIEPQSECEWFDDNNLQDQISRWMESHDVPSCTEDDRFC